MIDMIYSYIGTPTIFKDFGHKHIFLHDVKLLNFKLKCLKECNFIFAHETRIAIILYNIYLQGINN